MRNPFTSSKPTTLLANGAALHPHALREQALLFNTIVMSGAVALGYPFAFAFLMEGSYLPLLFLAAATGLSALAFAMHKREQWEAELFCQVVAISVAGMLMTLADSAIFDFGLAFVLMAILYALVASQSPRKGLVWLLGGATLALGLAGSAGWIANPFPAGREGGAIMAFTLFGAAILCIAFAADRLNLAKIMASANRMQTFSALVEGVMDAVIRFGPNGTPVFVSRSAGLLLGCQRFELDGEGLFERIHVMDRPAYRKALSDASNLGISATLDLRVRRDTPGAQPSSRYIWIELFLSPVEDDTSGADKRDVLGVARNIAARKNAEHELQRARVEAEEASEAKSRFLATIGHELRTPLNAIVGFSDMMSEGIGGTLSPTHREYAGHIRQSGHHLLEVVNMLLDMSKIEAGKFEVQVELFGPHALVEPCLQMVEKLGSDRGVSVEARLPENLPQIVGDERACRQIIINLLSNAVKFSHDGGRVTLAMKRQGKMLNISVSDQGIGMRPETISRIGEPFLQAQDDLSRRYEGTGLGLSIVKGLVSLHAGKLNVVSEPGAGTTVSVLLPIDGPAPSARPTANVEILRRDKSTSDEEKWLEDEKRSAIR